MNSRRFVVDVVCASKNVTFANCLLRQLSSSSLITFIIHPERNEYNVFQKLLGFQQIALYSKSLSITSSSSSAEASEKGSRKAFKLLTSSPSSPPSPSPSPPFLSSLRPLKLSLGEIVIPVNDESTKQSFEKFFKKVGYFEQKENFPGLYSCQESHVLIRLCPAKKLTFIFKCDDGGVGDVDYLREVVSALGYSESNTARLGSFSSRADNQIQLLGEELGDLDIRLTGSARQASSFHLEGTEVVLEHTISSLQNERVLGSNAKPVSVDGNSGGSRDCWVEARALFKETFVQRGEANYLKRRSNR